MPLIGTGDWNDGMNRVGEDGHGTSVWLGWLLIATIDLMAPLADTPRPCPRRALAGPREIGAERHRDRRLGWSMVPARHLR